jgi:hypothetical protein
MKNKKFLTNLICLLALFLNSSCLTKALWGDKHYDERINQFLVGQDGRYVILISSRYHYVLTDSSGILKEILALRQRDVLVIDPDQTNLKLESNNDIHGDLVIKGPFSLLPLEDIGILTSLGIRPSQRDEISIRIRVNGRRYQAKYLGEGVPVLPTSYVIPVYYSDSNLVKGIGKAAITPIAIGLDAVLTIGKIIVFPLSLGS